MDNDGLRSSIHHAAASSTDETRIGSGRASVHFVALAVSAAQSLAEHGQRHPAMPWPAGTRQVSVGSILLLPLCAVKASRPAVTGGRLKIVPAIGANLSSTKDLLILLVVARMHTHYGAEAQHCDSRSDSHRERR